eukprot:g4451.t1
MAHPAARALKGHAFVASPSTKQPFRIVDEQVYAKLGGNETLKPTPAIVHFGGFTLDEQFTQVLKIVNTSHFAQRLHVINTTTPYFSITCNKKGIVAPGMAENVRITFRPDEWRYYYDCIRVHCQEENLLIPIHAYPIANDVFFPEFIDFGKAALLDKSTKIIKLTCKVPIQFEYEITIVKPNSDFEVTPLKGVIPANGGAEVAITYCPVKLGTAEITLEVNVSQFNFKTMTCRIVGNAAPGITRNRVLKKLNNGPATSPKDTNNTMLGGSATLNSTIESSDGRDEDVDALNATTQSFSLARKKVKDIPLETYDQTSDLSWHGLGSGAAIDVGGAYIGIKTKRRHRRKMETLRQDSLNMTSEELENMAKKKNKNEIPDETLVDGIRIPRDLSTMSAVNFVLTQEVGKLKPKDLKIAVAKQRAMREKRRLEQEAMKTLSAGTMVANSDAIINETVLSADMSKNKDRQLKEMVFLQELRDLKKKEEELEFQTQRIRIGDNLLSSEDLKRIAIARNKTNETKARINRASERARYGTEMFGALCDGKELGRSECLSYLLGKPDRKPEFDIYSNNVWLMRKEVLQRFQNAANKIIIRRRVRKRYRMLKQKLRSANANTREAVKQFVERDNRLAASAGGSTKSNDGEKEEDNTPDLGQLVDFVPFSRYPQSSLGDDDDSNDSKDDSGSRGGIFSPVEADVIRDFDHLEAFALKQPFQAGLLNYKPMANLPISIYVPTEMNRKLRTGAEEEEPVRISAKVLPPPNVGAKKDDSTVVETVEDAGDEIDGNKKKLVLPLPKGYEQWLEAHPIELTTLLKPDAAVRVFLKNDEPRETSPEFELKPKYISFNPPRIQRRAIVSKPGCSSIGSIEGVAMVNSCHRQTRQFRFSSLSYYDNAQRLWDRREDLLKSLEEDDMMSETDSDEEPVEEEEPIYPTLALCRNLFEKDDEENAEIENTEEDLAENVNKEEVLTIESVPELLPLSKYLDRESNWEVLHAERAKDRSQRTNNFTIAINNVNDAIKYPRFKFDHIEMSV